MNRNPLIPFFIIMAFGIVLMFGLSFKGLGDVRQAAKHKGTSATTAPSPAPSPAPATQTASVDPQNIYKTTCIGCHGDQYQGVVGPSLKGIGSKLTVAQIKQIITHGKGPMPPDLVPESEAQVMAEWVSKIK